VVAVISKYRNFRYYYSINNNQRTQIMENNIVGWFEVPVSDMDRATKFYETVFGLTLERNKMGDLDMAWFPWSDNAPGSPGSLVRDEAFYTPGQEGPLIYFSSQTGDLNDEVKKVEAAGGKVISPKKLIAEDIGYMALIIDSEGNRIALHSRN
jgi:predicted enzyme related to lactoylglutathione lyase